MEINNDMNNNDIIDNNLLKYPYNINNKIYLDFSLTELEKKIFDFLIYVKEKNNLNNTTIRVVGGWVRDKLLGIENNDIDITVSNINCNEFAVLLNKELHRDKYKIGGSYKKSKNIEIVKVPIYGILIDIVNLCLDNNNKENPIFDAERRDITINALFYNLNEKKIENFCSESLNDIKNGIINTPLNPEITFEYDTFIIFRLIRFALKYRFKISDKINNTIYKNYKIYEENIIKKVAKERIKTDLFKIFEENNFNVGTFFYILYKYKLINAFFIDYKNLNSNELTENLNIEIINMVNNIILGEHIYKFFKEKYNDENFIDQNSKINLYLILITFNYYKYNGILNTNVVNVNRTILKKNLKVSYEIIYFISLICKNMDEFISLVNNNEYNNMNIKSLLKKIDYHHLLVMIICCITKEYYQNIKLDNIIKEIDFKLLDNLYKKYEKFHQYINENIMILNDFKLIISKKEIHELFNGISNKNMGILIKLIEKKQLNNPNINKDEAINYLKEEYKKLS